MRIRGFEKLNEGATLPKRSTKHSAGYDICAFNDCLVKKGEVTLIYTGICAYMQDDEYLAIFIRSSLAIKRGLTLANNVGIIDSDYYHNPDNQGEIIIAVRNNTNEDILIKKGERIAQGIFMKYLKSDDDNADFVRLGGIGSTTN